MARLLCCGSTSLQHGTASLQACRNWRSDPPLKPWRKRPCIASDRAAQVLSVARYHVRDAPVMPQIYRGQSFGSLRPLLFQVENAVNDLIEKAKEPVHRVASKEGYGGK